MLTHRQVNEQKKNFDSADQLLDAVLASMDEGSAQDPANMEEGCVQNQAMEVNGEPEIAVYDQNGEKLKRKESSDDGATSSGQRPPKMTRTSPMTSKLLICICLTFEKDCNIIFVLSEIHR